MNPAQQSLARKFVAYRTFSHMFFLSAVWLYFYRLFITDAQVGVLDGTAFFIGLIAEVPSGALADSFGRHRLVRIGTVSIAAGLLIQAAGSSFMPFFIGQSIMMIGFAFVSGSDEALFYQRLQFKDSKDWRNLLARAGQWSLVGSVFATAIGGYLHTINPRLPWILTGLSFVAAVLLVWSVRDTRAISKRGNFSGELRRYFKDILMGFKQFTHRPLFSYVPLIVVAQGLFYATGFGLLRLILLSRFEFSAVAGSVVVALAAVLTAISLWLVRRYSHRLDEKHILSAIIVSAAICIGFATFVSGIVGGLIIIGLYAGEYIMQPVISEALNKHAAEDQRATVLSVASFLKALPYVVLAPVIGATNQAGSLHFLLWIWAGALIAVLGFYMLTLRRAATIKI